MNVVLDFSDSLITKIEDDIILEHPFFANAVGAMIGSGTCSKFISFFSVDLLRNKIKIIKKYNLDIYFVTPNVRDVFFDEYKNIIDLLIEERLIDHLIVNDFGILNLFYNKIDIVLGRFFDKRYRDLRLAGGYICTQEIGVLNSEVKELMNDYGINKITIDSFLPEKFYETGCQIFIHYPYSLMTSGNICEIANLYSNQNFRNDSKKCSFMCLNHSYKSESRYGCVHKYMNALYLDSRSKNNDVMERIKKSDNVIIIYRDRLL